MIARRVSIMAPIRRARAGIAGIAAQDANAAVTGPQQVQAEAEEGALAGAVGAQDAVDAAGRDQSDKRSSAATAPNRLRQVVRFDESGQRSAFAAASG